MRGGVKALWSKAGWEMASGAAICVTLALSRGVADEALQFFLL